MDRNFVAQNWYSEEWDKKVKQQTVIDIAQKNFLHCPPQVSSFPIILRNWLATRTTNKCESKSIHTKYKTCVQIRTYSIGTASLIAYQVTLEAPYRENVNVKTGAPINLDLMPSNRKWAGHDVNQTYATNYNSVNGLEINDCKPTNC